MDKGAHFYRCDFQVHTPRDAQWRGRQPADDKGRLEYAAAFVKACRDKGLGAVAITDHHDFVYAPLIRAAAAAETTSAGDPLPDHEKLVVFPGLELTLGGVPCQALLILDADFPGDRLNQVLDALNIELHDPSQPRLGEVVPITHIHSLIELYATLDQRDWLRGRYIVLPNVTDGGHQTLMRAGMAAKYKEMPCVGGYLDGSIGNIGTGNARIFAGKDPRWGNKSIALFQTSDSRDDSFGDLGKFSTWVKWASPTAEALRQACLARESRISQIEPQQPSVWISRLVVSNSKFLGPVDLEFNSQYDAIIGGRGTGKSTILDYLRWGLCDQPPVTGDSDEVADPKTRQRRLIAATLEPYDASVEIYFSINDIGHVVRRYAKSGEVRLKVGDADFVKARDDDIRALLPIHAYSQKQLSSVSVRLDELTRFVTAPISRRLDEVDQQIEDVAGRLRENYATLQRFRALAHNIARSELNEQSLADQARKLRTSLGGLSAQDRAVLENKPAYDSLSGVIGEWVRQIEDISRSAQTLLGSVDVPLASVSDVPAEPAEVRHLVQEFAGASEALVRDLRSELNAALAKFENGRSADGTWSTRRKELVDAIEQFNAMYVAVRAKSTAHETRLRELAELEERQAATRELVQRQNRELQALGDPQELHTRLRNELVSLMSDRSALIARQCAELTNLSGGLLRATLQRGKELTKVEDRFRAAISGSSVRSSRVETVFQSLVQETDPISTWEAVLTELERLLLMEPETEITSEMTPTLTRLGFPLADQRRIVSRLTPDAWLDLALTRIDDSPAFEYQSKESEYIQFALASAGQQATALLRVLLAQTGMPLIIDQPEDDLDSQVVIEVVEQIWKAKAVRQLIFSSHNANLVVNGDAELVIVCDYRSAGNHSAGRVKIEGAIDVEEVRDDITRVMEGGEKAFRLRKEKYGF